jgi:predicted RNase H-like HicB family nuclease
MESKLSCGVSIHEEVMDGKKVFVAECAELGVDDFGESVDEALSNLKKGINLLLEEAPFLRT